MEKKKYYKEILIDGGSYTNDNGVTTYTYGIPVEKWENKRLVGYNIEILKTKTKHDKNSIVCVSRAKNQETNQYYWYEVPQEERLMDELPL